MERGFDLESQVNKKGTQAKEASRCLRSVTVRRRRRRAAACGLKLSVFIGVSKGSKANEGVRAVPLPLSPQPSPFLNKLLETQGLRVSHHVPMETSVIPAGGLRKWRQTAGFHEPFHTFSPKKGKESYRP